MEELKHAQATELELFMLDKFLLRVFDGLTVHRLWMHLPVYCILDLRLVSFSGIYRFSGRVSKIFKNGSLKYATLKTDITVLVATIRLLG